MRRWTVARAARPADEGGFALLVVLGGMLSLVLVLLATAAYIGNSVPTARRGQDASAALQAAQAGVDDYLARLSSCDSYWDAPCRAGETNPALSGWATVPASDAATPAQYHYDVTRTPNQEAGLLRVRATGRVLRPGGRSSKRTLVVDLRKKSLLEYIYYTDHEASDPATLVRRYPARKVAVDPASHSGYTTYEYGGITADEAAKCNRYFYATPSTPSRDGAAPTESIRATRPDGTYGTGSQGYSCDIQFAPIDTLDGPVYSKDAILLNGPLFKGPVSTRWATGSSPAPDPAKPYRIVAGGTDPQAAGYRPVYNPEDVTLPPSNILIRDRADPAKGGTGCLYRGPTRIVVKDNGTMDVTSPLTSSTNAACTRGTASAPGMTSAQNVPLPANGVVYVDSSPAPCGAGTPPAFSPASGDITPYDCAAGDVFVEGVLSGKLTIASAGNIDVTGNTTYKNGTTGGDVLGLVANGDVQVYHPVKCATAPADGYTCQDLQNIDVGLNDITISAAVLSVQHSFTVQNFNQGQKLGKLTLIGGIYQNFRGPVGTGGGTGTGYAKDYRFDARLKSLPPPSFVDPVAAPWAAKGYAEVQNPTGLPS